MSQLWSSGGLEVELVLRLLVDVPALPGPLHAGLVALDLEPVVVVLLVDLDVPRGSVIRMIIIIREILSNADHLKKIAKQFGKSQI